MGWGPAATLYSEISATHAFNQNVLTLCSGQALLWTLGFLLQEVKQTTNNPCPHAAPGGWWVFLYDKGRADTSVNMYDVSWWSELQRKGKAGGGREREGRGHGRK